MQVDWIVFQNPVSPACETLATILYDNRMGYKNVCLDCRKAFNRSLSSESPRQLKCPGCGKTTILLSHLFQPPSKDDLNGWATVKLLVDNGFTYDHIYKNLEKEEGQIIGHTGYVKYPENIREANEFIEKYKEQVVKINKKSTTT